MGDLIVTEFMTLDGVGQAGGAPDEDRDGGFEHGGWMAPLAGDDEDSDDTVFGQASTMNALLLGRRTYEIFSDFWPNAPEEIPFTGLLNGVPKYVASRTLADPLAWAGSTVLADDVEGAVTALRERYDQVHVIGSLHLVQTLLRLGLVDRMSLWMFPILLGSGKKVFADGTVPTTLRLTGSVTHSGGAVHLTYETAGIPTFGTIGEE